MNIVLDLLISTVKLPPKSFASCIFTRPGFISQRCILEFSSEIGIRFSSQHEK